MRIKCKIMNCDEPNKNGLVYPKNVVEDFVKNYNERVIYKDGFGLGELRHSNDNIDIFVKLTDVSHKINKLSVDNNELIFEGELLETLLGKIAKQIGIEKLGPAIVGSGEVHNKIVTKFNLGHIDLIDKTECLWEDASLTEIK